MIILSITIIFRVVYFSITLFDFIILIIVDILNVEMIIVTIKFIANRAELIFHIFNRLIILFFVNNLILNTLFIKFCFSKINLSSFVYDKSHFLFKIAVV